jgi:hypothetical protein
MKSVYIFPLLCAFMLGLNLNAQINYSEPSPGTAEYIEFQRLLENYNNNPLSDTDLPPGWEFTNTGIVHMISLFPSASPDFCGIPLQTGDFIGLFFIDENGQEKCGGCARWIDTTSSIGLFAFGDDSFTPDIKEGFNSGEKFIWYAYLYSMNEQIMPIAVPTYENCQGCIKNNKFGGSTTFPGLDIIKETIKVVYGNEIVIPAGWSGLSSFTETQVFPPFIADVMSPISNELVILQTFSRVYYPAAGTNTMFRWWDDEGYKIKVTEEAVLPMLGCPSDDLSVDLDATWNIMPVHSACNVLVTEVFNPIIDKVIVIKEIGGNKIFWPEMGIQSLQVLERGRAYFVAVSQNTSVEYSECDSYKSHPEPVEYNLINNTPWNTPVQTGSSHTIAFPSEIISNLKPGDYIAAFNDEGICTGLTQIGDPGESVALTVYGDDILTDANDGMAEGEQISFKIFKTSIGESMDAFVEFDQNYTQSDGTFADNGLSVLVHNVVCLLYKVQIRGV